MRALKIVFNYIKEDENLRKGLIAVGVIFVVGVLIGVNIGYYLL